jgi:hypothetical protein
MRKALDLIRTSARPADAGEATGGVALGLQTSCDACRGTGATASATDPSVLAAVRAEAALAAIRTPSSAPQNNLAMLATLIPMSQAIR